MPKTRKFTKDFLVMRMGETVSHEFVSHNRWSITYADVFKWEGKYYKTYYNVGATENQDESPYQYDDDEIECIEVEPVQVTVTQYVEV